MSEMKISMELIRCPVCNELFALPTIRQDRTSTCYCPNKGCSLQRQSNGQWLSCRWLADIKRMREWLDDTRADGKRMARRIAALQGVITKYKRGQL